MGCTGWPSRVDSDTLTALYPYQSVYFPADVITPGAIKPTNKMSLQIGSKQQAYIVHEFVKTSPTECYWTWQFRGIPIDLNDPKFKLWPHFIQIDNNNAPNPAEYAFMEYSIGVSYEKNSLSYDLEGPAEEKQKHEILGKWKSTLTGDSGLKTIAIPDLFGKGQLKLNKFNFLQLEIERWSDNPADTWNYPIYLLGVSLQYKTDFSNVREWPT